MPLTTDVQWWICTDWLKDGGKKKLGPFVTLNLALRVRGFVERAEGRDGAYFVDSESNT